MRNRWAPAIAGLVLLAASRGADAYTLNTIYSFCAQQNCADGFGPIDGLHIDRSGNLYGTTYTGGDANSGTVFELVANADKTAWTYKRLHSFCSRTNCADGRNPLGKLIADSAGYLFGTASGGGGAHGGGMIYELIPKANGKWEFSVLHKFCALDNCIGGAGPRAGLTYLGAAAGRPYDDVSSLYGTTAGGGIHFHGAVFALTPIPGQLGWQEEVVHSFCEGDACGDGNQPYSGVTVDPKGNLFGNTPGGGYCCGVAYALKRKSNGVWKENILHPFCSEDQCADGSESYAEPWVDDSGAIYGTTGSGGSPCFLQSGCGILFKLVRTGRTSQLTVLHQFCSAQNCTDGAEPFRGVIGNDEGDLFGTTILGGANPGEDGNGGGTVYRLSGSQYQVLYSFCALANCADGAEPYAALALDRSGNLFGTTAAGGANNAGTVFELVP